MSSLVEEARKNLEMAGLFNKDSAYGGMIGNVVMKLVECHCSGGHSGMSHSMTMQIFNMVINRKPLTSEYWDFGKAELKKWLNEHDKDHTEDFFNQFIKSSIGDRPE